MGRKRRQAFNFPSEEQPAVTDELDAQIDRELAEAAGEASETAKQETATRITKDAERKKKVAAAVKEIPQIFSPEQVSWLFNVYAGALSFIYSYLFKYEFETIFEALKFDDDLALTMAKPLAKICSKYAPSEWAGMTAEIELCASLGMWTVRSYGMAKVAVNADRDKKAIEQRNRNAVTQPRVDSDAHVMHAARA